MKAEDKVMVAVRIEPDLLEWFNTVMPINGAKQWFLESCFRELKALYDEGKFEPPVDLMRISVREVVKDL